MREVAQLWPRMRASVHGVAAGAGARSCDGAVAVGRYFAVRSRGQYLRGEWTIEIMETTMSWGRKKPRTGEYTPFTIEAQHPVRCPALVATRTRPALTIRHSHSPCLTYRPPPASFLRARPILRAPCATRPALSPRPMW
ncbi:hypothetical protein B0H14DRAFT_3488352 [Mycena olivaceomarginata]|nr:hypothetical protein B0H14DRAFT_3488352 [Mycena olivaceomarginata]